MTQEFDEWLSAVVVPRNLPRGIAVEMSALAWQASREQLKAKLLSGEMRKVAEDAIKDKWDVCGASTYSVAKAALEAVVGQL